MSLILAQWGGDLMDHASGGNPVDIWSNSLAVIGPSGPTGAQLETINVAVLNYFNALAPNLDSRVKLTFLKANEYQVTSPYHQITDPTHEDVGLNYRGTGGLSGQPLTTALRVTIDNGTRDRRTRGGWYLPCTAVPILENYRYSPTVLDDIASATEDFLNAVNALTSMTAAVWSRRDQSATSITRMRVGNVPDNISRRKNNLREAYVAATIVP